METKAGMTGTPEEAELLRIFIGEGDKHRGAPLHQAILEAARQQGLAGGTVLHGTAGFGAHSLIHTAKILRLSEDLPLVIEIIDKSEKIAAFLPTLEGMMDGGLVTLEKVRVLMYRRREKKCDA